MHITSLKQKLNFIFDKKFLVYILKCIIGVIFTYSLHLNFPKYKLYWILISFVLVLSPDDSESKKLSLNRIKGNVIGATLGIFFFFISPTGNIFIVCLGILCTIFLCYLLSLQNVIRMSLSSFVIVMIFQKETKSPLIAVYRMLSVILGSFLAIFLNIIFKFLTREKNETYSSNVK